MAPICGRISLLGISARIGRPRVARIGRPRVARIGRPRVARIGRPRVARIGRPRVARIGRPRVARIGRPRVARIGRPRVARIGRPRVARIGRPRVARIGRPRVARIGRPRVARIGRPRVARTSARAGPGHRGGLDRGVELLGGEVAERDAPPRAGSCPFVVGRLRDLGRLVVADRAASSAVTSISELAHVLGDPSASASRPSIAELAERAARVGRAARPSAGSCRSITGLNTLSSKLPCEPANADRGVVADHLDADHRHPSLCVGFTLPGMIDEPGSFSGRSSSPRPRAGRSRASGCRWRSS